MIRFENVLKRSFQDVLKTFLQDVLKKSWRCLEDVFVRRLEDVLKTFWRRLGKTSWKRLEDVLKTYDQEDYIGLDQDVLKTSWGRLLKMYELGEYIRLDKDFLKTFWRRLMKSKTKDVFKTSSRCLHQDDFLLGLQICGFIQDLGLAKCRATQLKPEKIWINEICCQPEKLYTEALLEVLSKAISEEINTTLKSKCMVCYDPALQVHACYLNNPLEKVDRNFDNAFQLVDL